MTILKPEAIKRVNAEVADQLPQSINQILKLVTTDNGYQIDSELVSDRAKGTVDTIAYLDKETGDNLLSLQEQGEAIIDQERQAEAEAKAKAEDERESRLNRGLCPECGSEVITRTVQEIPVNPNINPEKDPIASTGGWEMQKDCSCGHMFAAWTEKKQ